MECTTLRGNEMSVSLDVNMNDRYNHRTDWASLESSYCNFIIFNQGGSMKITTKSIIISRGWYIFTYRYYFIIRKKSFVIPNALLLTWENIRTVIA